MDNNAGNPFVLPGFGQTGEMGRNPLLASMEMMRQAWDSLAGHGGFGTASLAPTLSEEELSRRITDLRAVENWLRMNLAVLSNTIQGLEVQRSTIATLKSFAASAAASVASASETSSSTGAASQVGISPLEAVLGLSPKPAPDSASNDAPPADSNTDQSSPHLGATMDAAAATEAAQAWWNLLQAQFNTLAAATTATMQGVTASVANNATGTRNPASKPATKKAAARKTVRRADQADAVPGKKAKVVNTTTRTSAKSSTAGKS